MKLKFITKVDNSGAFFQGVFCYSRDKAKKMVRRLAVKRIIKSLFES